jgi:hypothetical protein
MCELDDLSMEQKKARADEILESYDYKQALCLRCPGVTHKDIDNTMKAILSERSSSKRVPKEEKQFPEKYGKDVDPAEHIWRPSGKKCEYVPLSEERTRELMAAKDTTIKSEPKPVNAKNYRSLEPEEVAALIQGNYHPDKFRYLRGKDR